MMKVQEYLLTHSLAQLAEEHGVYARVMGYKFSLNYDQIEARDSDPIAQECRGLVLRTHDATDVDASSIVGLTVPMARTMKRFFNYGQEAAADVDFENPDTRIYEKLDGTLCILYFDDVNYKWCVATRSVPEANIAIDGFDNHTFTSLFWHSIEKCSTKPFVRACAQREVLGYVSQSFTYCFELTTPENQIVVRYPEYSVTLLAVIDSKTGEEFVPDEWADLMGVASPVTYRLGSVTELMDFVSDRDPCAYEGVVVCDPNFNRVKVKSAGYLAFNKIRDNVLKSPRSLLEVILLEKLDDVSVVLSDVQKKVAFDTLDKYRALVHEQNKVFLELMSFVEQAKIAAGDTWLYGDKDHRKCFAVEAQSRGCSVGVMMCLYKQFAADKSKVPSFSDYVHDHKDPQHGWSNTFLDNLLRMMQD